MINRRGPCADDVLLRLPSAGTAGSSIWMLLNPRFNRRTLPNPASGQLGLGCWEVRVALHDLVDPLRGDTQQLGDLLRSHEMVRHSARILDVP